MDDLLDIDKFNVIEDGENYYFFRALNMADNSDIEQGITVSEDGSIDRIRTDRERYEQNPENGEPKYTNDSEISLGQVFDHIKMHYRKDTNCISLSSNANVSILYGRGSYKDKYVLVRVPKKEMGEKVINAGQYMLEEISKRINEYIASQEVDNELAETLEEIDNSTTPEELRQVISTRYTSNEEIDPSKAKMRKGITYRSPVARISSYRALSDDQSLEKNKIIAKLTLLERVKGMPPVVQYTSNNDSLVKTIGNAFSSMELIHYGDIEKEEIIDIPKEIVDIFSLLQQVEGHEKEVNELKREVIDFVKQGRSIEMPEESILSREYEPRNDISIEEIYDLTGGRVEFGMANSIVHKMFYLAKSQSRARELARLLNEITGNNPQYAEIIQYIAENGLEVEPEITTRQNNRGIKLSESVSVDLRGEEQDLLEQIKGLSMDQQIEIMDKGGLSNTNNVMNNSFAKTQRNGTISREEYYAEAIFSSCDWESIGIQEFTQEEKNNFIQRLQNEYCMELYQKLEERGIDRKDIPAILFNLVSRRNDFEISEEDTPETIKQKRIEQYERIINENFENLSQELSIERVERFLGYYDITGTGIQLRPYQQTATDRVDEILEENRFASAIMPTGSEKSVIPLDQLIKHFQNQQKQNEELIKAGKEPKAMLYLAPQKEIIEQIKDDIIKYIHGPVNTIGRSKDEIVADVFPNLIFSTYSNLLSKRGQELINKQYGFIVLDELHRTGAEQWGKKLDELLDNQSEDTKVLGITATSRRDTDGINMANEIAERLGYTNKEAVSGKHIAMNMSLVNAIRLGLVVNPKLVSCAYQLLTDGSLDKLEARIDDIEDVQEKNEKLGKYKELRRNIESAEGIPEILKSNVKQGGKYIVFLPIPDGIEDEDGNPIKGKKGRKKIQEWEKTITEYFKDSGLTLHFNSMLGEYSDAENAKNLEQFQNSESKDTELLLVFNKANEGLHLNKVDGIIWLRPMGENSRILYLQQLGRIIYSEDPDNPTKDEDRPVVIDLVNNTLKVKWNIEATEHDDIEMLNLVMEWSERHDGTLPNINSTDREESGYANMLKAIQEKYKQYLEGEYKQLNEKQIKEVQEIIRLGSKIDLWQIDLPNATIKNKISHEKSWTNQEELFELTEVLTDFVKLENEVAEIENATSVEQFIKTLVKLQEIGVDVSKITKNDTVETLAKKSGVNKEKLEELGLDGAKKIGFQKRNIAQVYRGTGHGKPPTKEQVEELASMGISLEKIEKDTVQEFIDTLSELKRIGVDVSKLTISDTLETLAKKSDINREKLEELGLDGTKKIGFQKNHITQSYRGNADAKPPTKEQVEELASMGISLEKIEKDTVQEFIDTLSELKRIGVDVSIIIQKDTIETLAKKSGVTKEKLEELGIDGAKKIGIQKNYITRAYRGKVDGKPPTKEQVEELASMGISLKKEKRNAVQEFIDTLSKLQEIGVDVSKIKQRDTIETLAKKSGINREKLEEHGIDGAKKIGIQKDRIAHSYRGKRGGIKSPTKEQAEILVRMGISLEKEEKDIVQEFIDTLSKLQEIRVDVSIITLEDTIETLAKKSGINREELEKLELDGAKKIGIQKGYIAQAYRGTGNGKPPTKEQVEELAKMGISLERRQRTGKEIAEASISSLTDIEMADKEDTALKELVEKTKEGGMNLDEQS